MWPWTVAPSLSLPLHGTAAIRVFPCRLVSDLHLLVVHGSATGSELARPLHASLRESCHAVATHWLTFTGRHHNAADLLPTDDVGLHKLARWINAFFSLVYLYLPHVAKNLSVLDFVRCHCKDHGVCLDSCRWRSLPASDALAINVLAPLCHEDITLGRCGQKLIQLLSSHAAVAGIIGNEERADCTHQPVFSPPRKERLCCPLVDKRVWVSV